MRTNEALLTARPPVLLRWANRAFRGRSFMDFALAYLAVASVPLTLEMLTLNEGRGGAELVDATAATGLILTAQVGALTVVSIAIALVTILSQQEGNDAEVRLYYHASLAQEVVASSFALLVAALANLVWPRAALMLPPASIFLQALVLLQIVWAVVNLALLAYFLRVTFAFVRRTDRERFREWFVHETFASRLREDYRAAVFRELPSHILPEGPAHRASALFGMGSWGSEDAVEELRLGRSRRSVVRDVRVRPVRWALRSWARRCDRATAGKPSDHAPLRTTATLILPFGPGSELPTHAVWCRRQGGVPLSVLERAALRMGMRFGRAPDA